MRTLGVLLGLLVAVVSLAASPGGTAHASGQPPASPQAARVLVVGAGAPYRSIGEALASAGPGDTIEVHGGTHAGPVVVGKPVALVGVGSPVLDGQGRGTVVTLAAPGASLRGFVVRSSGSGLDGDAGVEVRAAGVTVEGNQLEDVLYGISLDNAPGSVVRGNSVRGKDRPVAERGDGLRLWYSSDVLLEGNHVQDARDCVVWYSTNVRVLGNQIERGRYGLHFMYDDGAEVTGNVLRGNSVGAYLMYSRGVTLRGNLLAASRGPSGFGLGLKDVDGLVAEGNWLVDNRVGAWVDNSPSSLDSASRFHANLFAYNDIGVTLQPSVERNIYWDNAFRENQQQVSVQGGGALHGNDWSKDGRGNYWSDYAGFDADGDGVGDVPYRVEALFDDLMDRQPELRLFQYGLAADAIDFAARAFPGLRPAPRLVDRAPLVAPPAIPAPPGLTRASPLPGLGVALGLLALAAGALGLGRARFGERGADPVPRPPTVSGNRDTSSPFPRRPKAPGWDEGSWVARSAPPLSVSHLTQRFGRSVAVDDLSFAVEPGEVVALWGPNGAGKTTVLKCIVGLLPGAGDVAIAGLDARRRGKEARRALGYVPQEVAFHDDLTVAETIRFYARLKRAPVARGVELLADLDLAAHADKRVGALSGGLRQRLALALALLADPPLLLLDEPTSNLDAAGREHILRLLAGLRPSGTAIVIASHRLEEVEALADRVLVLERGRLAFECAPHELARRLGLQLSLRLRVAGERRDEALAILRAGGLALGPNGGSVNGSSIKVAVRPTEKALPIRLLERAGIAVADFDVEDELGDRPESTPDGWRGLGSEDR